MALQVAEEALQILQEAKTRTSNLDSEIIVEFSEDKSVCFLLITYPKLSGRIPIFSNIISSIEKYGVLNIDQSLIKKALEKRFFDKKFTVEIRGSVKDVKIRCVGNIKITGDAVSCIIRTEGTLTVEGALSSCDVQANQAEDSKLSAGGSVRNDRYKITG